LALVEHGLTVKQWLTDRAGWQEWETDRSSHPRRLTPDAVVTLDLDGWQAVAFVEVDLPSMTQTMLKQKVGHYLAYADDLAWQDRHPYCPPMLLTSAVPFGCGQTNEVRMSLSAVIRVEGLVVVSAVTAGRDGECDAMQVMTASPTAAEGSRAIRSAGYRHIKRITHGRLPMTADDLAIAVRQAGAVFERPWLTQGPWRPADPSTPDP
jgi:hypothetical protein